MLFKTLEECKTSDEKLKLFILKLLFFTFLTTTFMGIYTLAEVLGG